MNSPTTQQTNSQTFTVVAVIQNHFACFPAATMSAARKAARNLRAASSRPVEIISRDEYGRGRIEHVYPEVVL